MRNSEDLSKDIQLFARAECLRIEAVQALMIETKRAEATRATRITVETETMLIVRRAKTVLAWCPECRAEVDVITLDSLPEPVTATHIHEWFGTSRLHFWQMPEGPVGICVNSLLQFFVPETNGSRFNEKP